jgi:isopentenyl diphosphate isomerase/L-lactate dehydrogenase-like FMN-dependent dehydrogenase
VATAANAFGTLPIVSSATLPALEQTAAASDSPKIFQLYIRGDWAWVTGKIDRIKVAGYQGFCLTVDSALYSRRERPMLSRWSVDNTRAPQHREWQARVTWNDVDRMRDYAGLPFVLKGIMSPEDAALAVQHGADAVWVSNHGGRQLDHGEGTLDVLPEIIDVVGDAAEVVVDSGILRGTDVIKALALGARAVAIGQLQGWGLAGGGQLDHGEGTLDVLPEIIDVVGDAAEVVVDGGILRGTDVIKALALGARAVAIGKLQGWGLAAGGQDGVVRVLEILDEEMRVSMGLLGVTSVDQLNKSYLRPAHPTTPPHEMSAWVNLPGNRLV